MNCKKIQELILTDYVDGEMDEGEKEVVLRHSANCVDCQNFMVTAKEMIHEPFRNVESINPDALLWYKIKQGIETEKERHGRDKPSIGILEMMRYRGRILIPAIVMAVVVIVVIWTDIITFQQFSMYRTGRTDSSQEASLAVNYGMEDESVEYALMENANFQTAIEEYFL